MDEKFLKRCAQGHAQEQRVLYERYAPRLYGVCLRYASGEAMAQDMLQEGFVKIFRGLSSYRHEGHFEGWLHRVMVNTALEWLRKERPPSLSLHDEAPIAGSGPSPLEALSEEEILSAMRRLPVGLREVANLYIVDGYSHREIAESLGISEDNSKQRLHRARELLKQMIITMNRMPNGIQMER
jgi:RNA polymerase sigma-70 factor (ECF subfamily)